MTAIREALMRVEAMAGHYRNSQRFFRLGREARAELEALEAVAEAARALIGQRFGSLPLERDVYRTRVALARLAAVQDGQTERERHKVEMPDAKREEADEPRPITGLSATPGEGFDSPRSPRSVCPCRVHGDPDGDCGERCA